MPQGDRHPQENPFAARLSARVRVSPRLCRFNRWVHALALGVLLAMALYRPSLLPLSLVIGVSFWSLRRRVLLAAAHSVCWLSWADDGHWTWQTRAGQRHQGYLQHATVLGRHCVFLQLRATEHRFATVVPLAADSMLPSIHRRLRARLTLWSPPAHDRDDLLQVGIERLRAFMARR